ncbi:glycine-rich RNA-binding protein 3, mitochondrial-like [Chrysoperla carnea]|uniref:glycine-rich RNA-binding protein 3, mitochondrial-like n=1 Tax=Chrysoperla carnea TaxID=189513 RepID=UPI001D07ADED|nr:glycine-rich RNA-binding protein 3, mitochondrial-like [Chrysoperla carnea]
MSLNKILSTLCAIIVCLTFVLSSPIPVPENALTQLVELDASPIQAIPIVSDANNNPTRIARHLFKHKHHGGGSCNRCGGGGYGGHGGGGYGGSGSFAGAAAGSGSHGGSSQSQAQAASFGFGPFTASIASAASFGGNRGGGFFDY